jgi:hypothetical protein
MPYFDFSTDNFSTDEFISVEEFLDACGSNEIENLIQALIDNGHLSNSVTKISNAKEFNSPSESIYEDALDKLHGKWNMLSQEEEQLILNIANRF